ETVEIQPPVIDRGVFRNDVAPAVEAAVPHGDLIGLDPGAAALLHDPRAKAPGGRQYAKRRDGIAEPPEPLLDFRVELLGQLAAETDARDVEEGMAIHQADIDPPCPAGYDEV